MSINIALWLYVEKLPLPSFLSLKYPYCFSVSDNSVNTFNRQKYWNFELDLKDIIIFFSSGSTRFSNIWDFPSISSDWKEIQRTNCSLLVKWLPEISTRKRPGSWWKAQEHILKSRTPQPKYQPLKLGCWSQSGSGQKNPWAPADLPEARWSQHGVLRSFYTPIFDLLVVQACRM